MVDAGPAHWLYAKLKPDDGIGVTSAGKKRPRRMNLGLRQKNIMLRAYTDEQ